MTDEKSEHGRAAVVLVVLTAVIAVGMTVGFAGGSAVLAQQNGTEDAADDGEAPSDEQRDQGKNVTAEGVEVSELRLENLSVTGLEIDLGQLRQDGTEAAVEDALRQGMGSNVEGLEVESVEFGNVTSADISVENNVATVDAEVESVTVEGISAERLTLSQGGDDANATAGAAGTQSQIVGGMMQNGSLDADRAVAEGISIDRVVVERAGGGPQETPTDNGTETPDNVTETPDNVTETPDNGTEMPDDNETDAAEPSASVQFEDQSSNGTHVLVDEVNTSDGGFVAIHDASLLDGNVIGSVVGVTEYLEAGENQNVSAELYNVSGAEFNQTELEEDQLLIAMPHQDTNDNQTYDFVAEGGEADGPYTADGEAVVDTANVTVDGNGTTDGNETNTSASLGLAG